jgi:hypothetical protein
VRAGGDPLRGLKGTYLAFAWRPKRLGRVRSRRVSNRLARAKSVHRFDPGPRQFADRAQSGAALSGVQRCPIKSTSSSGHRVRLWPSGPMAHRTTDPWFRRLFFDLYGKNWRRRHVDANLKSARVVGDGEGALEMRSMERNIGERDAVQTCRLGMISPITQRHRV